MSHKFHTGKAWRHFVNQLGRRLPEVLNPNCQIPWKTQSPNRKRWRGLSVSSIWNLGFDPLLGFEAWDFGTRPDFLFIRVHPSLG
jgi:hypothetical protein